MWSFQYKHGDRPLEGYTIQRAAGRGGFGEVYYAVSDSGREVALKAVQGYEQIELRGISQCMNLKSPHLVSIFDVRHNDQGRPFVIMEFVSGPSLRHLLDESPSGLGEQKAAFFLREMAKGLTFLHDCGIVHRDLKPGNVFYENGYVKIGDYGLSKAISVGQTSQQTVTVGTVHYMAPEIGAGKYDRSIDIYALGAVLFEMLTGTVPFIGASPSEILMKHLSNEPDCSGIAEPFATVIKKAMHKDPSRRYQSVQEMVEAVFGAEHVRNSMSVFSPEELSVVAGRVAQRIHAPVGASPESSSVVRGSKPQRDGGLWARLEGRRSPKDANRVGQVGQGATVDARADVNDYDFPLAEELDPMRRRDRRLLAIFTSIVVALATAVLEGRGELFVLVMLASWGATLGIVTSARHMLPRLRDESNGMKRFTAAIIAIGGALVFSTFSWAMTSDATMMRTWVAVVVSLLVMDSQKWTSIRRPERVAAKYAVGAGFVAFLIGIFVSRGDRLPPIAIMAAVALMVQVLTPWSKDLARTDEDDKSEEADEDSEKSAQPAAGIAGAAAAAADAVAAAIPVELGGRFTEAPASDAVARASQPSSAAAANLRPVPGWARAFWVVLFAILFTVGVMLLIAGAQGAFTRPEEQAAARGFGVGAIVAAGLSLLRSASKTYRSKWQYFVRPILLTLCLESIIVSSIITGTTPNMRGDERMIGIFFIVFPAILFVTVVLISNVIGASKSASPSAPEPLPIGSSSSGSGGDVSPHSRGVGLGLCFLAFAGLCGIQRFYVGKIGTGVLYVLTGGLAGIGQLLDTIWLASGEFEDAQGRKLKNWETAPRANVPPIPPVPPVPPTPPHARGANVHAINAGNLKIEIQKRWGRSREPQMSMTDSYRRRRARTESGGIMSVVAALLIFASMVVAVALALDVPGFLAAGLPDPMIAKDLTNNVFGYDGWPSLMRTAGMGAIAILMFLGLCVLIFARRNGGVGYTLRGVIGSIGLIGAMIPLGMVFQYNDVWEQAAPLFKMKQVGLGMEEVLKVFRAPPTYVAALIFLVSIILIAIPAPRRRRVVAQPARPALQQRPSGAPSRDASQVNVAVDSSTPPASSEAETIGHTKGA